jgi:hypothetical protein
LVSLHNANTGCVCVLVLGHGSRLAVMMATKQRHVGVLLAPASNCTCQAVLCKVHNISLPAEQHAARVPSQSQALPLTSMLLPSNPHTSLQAYTGSPLLPEDVRRRDAMGCSLEASAPRSSMLQAGAEEGMDEEDYFNDQQHLQGSTSGYVAAWAAQYDHGPLSAPAQSAAASGVQGGNMAHLRWRAPPSPLQGQLLPQHLQASPYTGGPGAAGAAGGAQLVPGGVPSVLPAELMMGPAGLQQRHAGLPPRGGTGPVGQRRYNASSAVAPVAAAATGAGGAEQAWQRGAPHIGDGGPGKQVGESTAVSCCVHAE